MMVWLWGVCLWVFSQSTVNYAKIFDLDQNHLTHREIWKVLILTSIHVVWIPYTSYALLRIWSSDCGATMTNKMYSFSNFHFLFCYMQCSIWMTIIVPTSMTAYLYLYSHGEVSLAASQPV